jgi:Ca2+:H+ antiporter
VLVSSWGRDVGQPVELIGVVVVLVGAVLAAVRQAVTVALRVGEPAGSLLLAVTVTVIAVALIVPLMISGGHGRRH